MAKNHSNWNTVGLVMLAAYAVILLGGWKWGSLATWQEIELYKQLTGLALVLLIVAQWRLTLVRVNETPRRAGAYLWSHRYWGALAPLLLFLHAQSPGHAFVRMMLWSFLGLLALGLLHRFISRLNQPWLMTGWLVVHTALAALLIPLISYHAFNSFYYE